MIPELGVEHGKLTQCPSSPNCVSSQAKDEKHYIDPIVVTDDQVKVKNHLLAVLHQLEGAKIVAVEDNYVRAAFTSKLFRFVDDVEFYFPGVQSKTTTIHVRSASRVGYSDLGANRKRIEHIRSKLNAQEIFR